MNLVEFMKKVLGIKLTVYQKEIVKFYTSLPRDARIVMETQYPIILDSNGKRINMREKKKQNSKKGERQMTLEHIDDYKAKWQSHEVSIKDEDFSNIDADFYSGDPFDIIGYGETKEDAYENFKEKFKKLMSIWNDFEKDLLENKIPIN